MKPEARAEARRLREQEGMAITAIARCLGVSKGSVSGWVRDIRLTDDQQAVLRAHYTHYENQHRGSRAVADKYRALRAQYQAAGRAKARAGDPLHLAGCMLYWAEGSKSRNLLRFGNADPVMITFFARFLREALDIKDEQFQVHVSCYTDNGLSLQEIEAYWLALLGLPETALRKSAVNNKPRSSRQRGRKLLHVCYLTITSTAAVQHVFGAIQEYTGIDKPEWLD